MCSVRRNHYPVRLSFPHLWLITALLTRVRREGATNGAEITHPSESPRATPSFCEVHVARSLVFWAVLWRSLYSFTYIGVQHNFNISPTRFQYQLMFISSNSHTRGVDNGAGTSTLPKQTISSLFFVGFKMLNLYFYSFFEVVFCRPLFVYLYFCLSLFCFSPSLISGFWFRLGILNSNFSYTKVIK